MKLVTVFIAAIFVCQICTGQIYVSPTGNDGNKGTLKSPFASLEKAIQWSRVANVKTIILTKGNYYNVDFHLTVKDSGLQMMAEKPNSVVLYGGTRISDWKTEGNYLVSSVAGKGKVNVRALEVNGTYRERSRMPSVGAFQHNNIWDAKWVSSQAGGWDRQPTYEDLTTMKYLDNLNEKWINPNGSELVIYHEWDESIVGIKSIDTINNIIRFTYPATHPAGAFAERNKNANTFVIYNVKDALQPGQWYYDNENARVYYYPLSSEKKEDLTAVAGTKNQLLTLDSGANNITISDLVFSTATAQMVNPGYAADKITAAIQCIKINNVNFHNVTIRNSAGWGFRIRGTNVFLDNCKMENLGAGGINFQGNKIVIDSCQIHDMGKIDGGSVGINGSGNENTISNCDIYNIPYCGINGFGCNSLVYNNLIYNIKTFMQDGGAIYSGGDSLAILRHNAVLSDYKKKITVNAYYFDEQMTNSVAEFNIAINTGNPNQIHMAKGITYNNNIFMDKGLMNLPYANSSELNFSNNILIADKIKLTGPEKGLAETIHFDNSKVHAVMQPYSFATGITTFKGNILNSKSGEIKHDQIIQYGTIKVVDYTPANNSYGDPMFADFEHADFSFRPNSPAIKQGIKALNFDHVGCTDSFKRIFKQYTE